MFTGIIEEIGTIKSYNKKSIGADIVIECSKILEDSNIGDSISIDGVCQTIVSMGKNWFSTNVSNETLNVTTFNNFQKGDAVNLERALTLNSRLGGHIVTGHVDCIAKIISLNKLGDYYHLKIELPKIITKYVVQKGSITVNGISLTIAECYENVLKLAIIPHTYENTNLSKLKTGNFVNIETDTIAKYVEKMVLLNRNNDSTNISMDFLKENGYV